MLFMMIVKASRNSEAGNLPSPELREAMTKYNEELVKAGVWVMANGLHPSSNGIRLSFPRPEEKPVVTDGPCGCRTRKDMEKVRLNCVKYFRRRS